MLTEILNTICTEKIPDIQSIALNTEIGYLLEIDLEVPVHLYNFFANYSLVSKRQIVLKN